MKGGGGSERGNRCDGGGGVRERLEDRDGIKRVPEFSFGIRGLERG